MKKLETIHKGDTRKRREAKRGDNKQRVQKSVWMPKSKPLTKLDGTKKEENMKADGTKRSTERGWNG